MSELAFDGNGEPIEFPAEAEELRVRRFRNPGMRGACEVVHDRDGAPLYVAVDASYLEFRKIVEGVPGRYRLDPVDAGRRVVGGATAAYVTISEAPGNSSGGPTEDRDGFIRELVRANAEMTRTIAEGFAGVMQAAAELVRAADGAGLSRREPFVVPAPPPSPPVVEEEDDDDEDDEDELEEAGPDVAALINQILPMVQMWLASKSGPRPHDAPPAASPAPAAGPPAASPAAPTSEPAAAATPPAPTAGTTAESVRNAAPTAAQTARLFAIYQALEPDERRLVQHVVTRMTDELKAEWLADLDGMTTEQAVELVRSMIRKAREQEVTT